MPRGVPRAKDTEGGSALTNNSKDNKQSPSESSTGSGRCRSKKASVAAVSNSQSEDNSSSRRRRSPHEKPSSSPPSTERAPRVKGTSPKVEPNEDEKEIVPKEEIKENEEPVSPGEEEKVENELPEEEPPEPKKAPHGKKSRSSPGPRTKAGKSSQPGKGVTKEEGSEQEAEKEEEAPISKTSESKDTRGKKKRGSNKKGPQKERKPPAPRKVQPRPKKEEPVFNEGEIPSEQAWDVLENMCYSGTEYSKQDSVDDHNWSWHSLAMALSPGGRLYESIIPRHKSDLKEEHESVDPKDDNAKFYRYLYLFATTEVQHVKTANHPEGQTLLIPVIVSIQSQVDLGPARVGVKGVQMEKETIVPGSHLRMEWRTVPLDPDAAKLRVHSGKGTGKGTSRTNHLAYVLAGSQRLGSASKFPIERQKLFEFSNPYFFIPKIVQQKLDETMPEMVPVRIYFHRLRKSHEISFCPGEDEFPSFANEVIDEMKLTGPLADPDMRRFLEVKIKDTCLQSAREFKENWEAEHKQLQEQLDALSEFERVALDHLKVVKWYPFHSAFDMTPFAAPVVSRYLGMASECVVGEPGIEDEDDEEEESDL